MNPNIDIYLRSAFKELDAFAIPQVGTFRKIHRAAHIASQLGELRPPVLEIEFDTEVRDSLLLTSYLTNNIHMGRGEAQQIVDDISETISRALKSRRKFEIAEIGLLRKNSEGKVSFSTSLHNRNIFTDDYFGLQPLKYTSPTPSVEIEPNGTIADYSDERTHVQVAQTSTSALRTVFMVGLILMFGITIIYTARTERATLTTGVRIQDRDFITQQQSPTPPVSAENREVLTEMGTQVESEQDHTDTPQKETDDNFADKQAVEAVSRVSKEDQNPNNLKPERELFAEGNTRNISNDFDELESSDTRAINTREGVTRGGKNATSEDIDIDVLRQGAENVTSTQTLYYLIYASFTTARKAKDHISTVQTKLPGYDAVVLYPPEGSSRPYRVSIYRSSNESEVNRVMNQLKKKGYDDLWIFEDK